MSTLAETFKTKRLENHIRPREISAQTGVDAALLSKFERGERLPTEEQAHRAHAGRYRSVPVRISGSRHEPPQPYLLDKLMEDYFRHYEQQKRVLHPVILAADMHGRLVSIHPFLDGNGRTSRLVMNLILLRNGYTIATLKGDPASRMAYYQALEKVQMDNDREVFYHLVVDAALRSLEGHLALV